MRRSLHAMFVLVNGELRCPLQSSFYLPGLDHSCAWSHQHMPTHAHYCSKSWGRKDGRVNTPPVPRSSSTCPPMHSLNCLSQEQSELEKLKHMLSSFPASLTPAHVHSVLAWAIDHYEQLVKGAMEVKGTNSRKHTFRHRQGRRSKLDDGWRQSLSPAAEGTRALPHGPQRPEMQAAYLHTEHCLLADVMKTLEIKLKDFNQWNLQLLQACNCLATLPNVPPPVRKHAIDLTAAAVHGVLRNKDNRQQAVSHAVSNALTTLSHGMAAKHYASFLSGPSTLDALPGLVPFLMTRASWNLARALSKLGLSHLPTFQALSGHLLVKMGIQQLSTKELALLAHAFATVGARDEPLFDGISQVLFDKMDQLNSQDISMMASALATLKLPHPPLLTALASALVHLTSAHHPPSSLVRHTHPVFSSNHHKSPVHHLPQTPLMAAAHAYAASHHEQLLHRLPPDPSPAATPSVSTPPSAAAAVAAALPPGEDLQQPCPPSSLPIAQPPELLRTNAPPPSWQACIKNIRNPQDAQDTLKPTGRLPELTPTNASLTHAKLSWRPSYPPKLSCNDLAEVARACLKLRSKKARPLAEAVCSAAASMAVWGAQEAVPEHLNSCQHRCYRHQQQRLTTRELDSHWLMPRQTILLLSAAAYYKTMNQTLLDKVLLSFQKASMAELEQQVGLAPLVHLLLALAKTSDPSLDYSSPQPLPSSPPPSNTTGTPGAPPTQPARQPDSGHGQRQLSMQSLLQAVLERLSLPHAQLSPWLAAAVLQALAALKHRDHFLVSQLLSNLPTASPPTPHTSELTRRSSSSSEKRAEMDDCSSNSVNRVDLDDCSSGLSSGSSSSSSEKRADLDDCSSGLSSVSSDQCADQANLKSMSHKSSDGSRRSMYGGASRLDVSGVSHSLHADMDAQVVSVHDNLGSNSSRWNSVPKPSATAPPLCRDAAARTLCALAELQHQDTSAAHWLAKHALQGNSGQDDFRPPLLAHLAWALVKLHIMDPAVWQSLVTSIARSTHPFQASSWHPHHVTQVIWALGEAYPGDGVAHVPGWDRAVHGVLKSVEDQLPRFKPRQLLLTLHGLACIRCGLPALPVVDHVVLQASRCVARQTYNLDELLVMLWSSVVAGHGSHVLYDLIAEALLPKVSDLQLGGAALAAWCYLRHANYLHPSLTERLLDHCIALLSEGDNQGSGKAAVGRLQDQKHADGQHELLGMYQSTHTEEGFQKPISTQPMQEQECSAVVLLTLAASFASCPKTFASVESLFSSIAARASCMQQQGPLDPSEHEALTQLMAILRHWAKAESSLQSSSRLTLAVAGSNEVAYPTLPLSLRLTPSFIGAKFGELLMPQTPGIEWV